MVFFKYYRYLKMVILNQHQLLRFHWNYYFTLRYVAIRSLKVSVNSKFLNGIQKAEWLECTYFSMQFVQPSRKIKDDEIRNVWYFPVRSISRRDIPRVLIEAGRIFELREPSTSARRSPRIVRGAFELHGLLKFSVSSRTQLNLHPWVFVRAEF